jgi:hypothetical protein
MILSEGYFDDIGKLNTIQCLTNEEFVVSYCKCCEVVCFSVRNLHNIVFCNKVEYLVAYESCVIDTKSQKYIDIFHISFNSFFF